MTINKAHIGVALAKIGAVAAAVSQDPQLTQSIFGKASIAVLILGTLYQAYTGKAITPAAEGQSPS